MGGNLFLNWGQKTILQCKSSLACNITVKSGRVVMLCCELGTDPDSVEFWKVYSKQYNLLMQSR